MTWSWTYCWAIIMFRTRLAAGGILIPRASSTARMEAKAWTVVQTPQARWAKAQASRGSRPLRIRSIPRTIVPDE